MHQLPHPDSGRSALARCVAIAGCETAPPPPMVRPAAFIPLGVGAAYLYGDVIGGYRARAAKMRAAKIRPLSAGAVPAYMAELDRELRQQTAGIGLDVLNLGNSIVIRIPATFTFDAGSAAVKPQTDATLLEIARTRENPEPDLRRRARPHRHDRNAAGQSGAVGEAGRRGCDLSSPAMAWRRRASRREVWARPPRSTIPTRQKPKRRPIAGSRSGSFRIG